MDEASLTLAMEEAIVEVNSTRRLRFRAIDELHQLEESLRIKEANADRIINLWLRMRKPE